MTADIIRLPPRDSTQPIPDYTFTLREWVDRKGWVTERETEQQTKTARPATPIATFADMGMAAPMKSWRMRPTGYDRVLHSNGTTPEMRGVYFTLLEQMMAKGGPIEVTPQTGYSCGSTPAKFKRILTSLLTEKFLTELPDGRIACDTFESYKRRSEEAKRRTIPASLKFAVFRRDDFTCVYCGEYTENPDCDHVVPVSRGGLTTIDNLATACPTCNRSKGALTPSEWLGQNKEAGCER